MRRCLAAAGALLALLGPGPAAAAASFAGTNLYYAAGLSKEQQDSYFSGLQSAGIKVLRVWLDGQNSQSTKGTAITSYPDLEPNTVGSFDDTVLELIDQLMLNARAHGIKLLISMHSFNALQRGDAYSRWWGDGYFYENSDATRAFDNRLKHILWHTHKTLGKPWKDLSDYIFAFEAQNEAMIGKGAQYVADHQQWQCDRAATIKSVLGENSGILVTTGGESWLDESLQSAWFECGALDVLAIHAYGTGDFDANKIRSYVQKAQAAGKKLIFQEWGACYFDTSNNDCPQGNRLDPAVRAGNIRNWANQISSAGVPWMYWQVIPNEDPHWGADFEIALGGEQWDVFKEVALKAGSYQSAFDFTPWLAADAVVHV